MGVLSCGGSGESNPPTETGEPEDDMSESNMSEPEDATAMGPPPSAAVARVPVWTGLVPDDPEEVCAIAREGHRELLCVPNES